MSVHHIFCTRNMYAGLCGLVAMLLTEKPIALSIADAEEMMRTAQECGKQLGVIFQNRYIEGIQEAKRLLGCRCTRARHRRLVLFKLASSAILLSM